MRGSLHTRTGHVRGPWTSPRSNSCVVCGTVWRSVSHIILFAVWAPHLPVADAHRRTCIARIIGTTGDCDVGGGGGAAEVYIARLPRYLPQRSLSCSGPPSRRSPKSRPPRRLPSQTPPWTRRRSSGPCRGLRAASARHAPNPCGSAACFCASFLDLWSCGLTSCASRFGVRHRCWGLAWRPSASTSTTAA